MIFELVSDFAAVLEVMPSEHQRRRILSLVDEAIRRDIHFIDRHPTTLFQCLWNMCWWYDCPEAAKHYDPPKHGWPPEGPPWESRGAKLYTLIEFWRREKERLTPGFPWIRSIRPYRRYLYLEKFPGAVLYGHNSSVASVSFSRDGRYLVSGSEDNTVRVWDMNSHREMLYLRGHDNGVTCVMFSRDGRFVASGSKDKTIRLWDAATGRQATCLRGHTDAVTCTAFSSDGQLLASGSVDHTVRVWNLSSGEQVLCLRGHTKPVRVVVFYLDSPQIFSGSDDGVRIWDARSGGGCQLTGIEVLRGMTTWAVAGGGQRIAFGDSSGVIYLWMSRESLSSEQLDWLHQLQGYTDAYYIQISFQAHDDEVVTLAFSPNDDHLATASADQTICLWRGRDELVWFGGHEVPVSSMAISPDGQHFVTGLRNGAVTLWDRKIRSKISKLHSHNDKLDRVAFSQDGCRVLSRSHDGRKKVWDTTNGQRMAGKKVIRDTVDIAREPPRQAWRAASTAGETVIQAVTSEVAIAWLPAELQHLEIHPAGHTGAGAAGRHLYLFTLEGNASSTS